MSDVTSGSTLRVGQLIKELLVAVEAEDGSPVVTEEADEGCLAHPRDLGAVAQGDTALGVEAQREVPAHLEAKDCAAVPVPPELSESKAG